MALRLGAAPPGRRRPARQRLGPDQRAEGRQGQEKGRRGKRDEADATQAELATAPARIDDAEQSTLCSFDADAIATATAERGPPEARPATIAKR